LLRGGELNPLYYLSPLYFKSLLYLFLGRVSQGVPERELGAFILRIGVF